MSRRSSCPECGTILRIRDRSFVGRRVHCPECKTGLRIAASETGDEIIVRRLTPDELAGKDHPEVGVKESGVKLSPDKILVTGRERQTILSRILASPLTAAWLLAIAISVLVAVLALAPKHRFAPRPTQDAPVKEPTVDIAPVTEESPAQSENPSTNAADLISQPPANEETPVTPEEMIETESTTSEENMTVEVPIDANHVEPEPTAEPPLAPPPPKIDIQSKLSQKLISYKQIKPASRRDLIDAFEEHLGAPIHYDADDLGASNLDQTVAFELVNTTLGDVIRNVADSAGWDVLVEESGLRLSRK